MLTRVTIVANSGCSVKHLGDIFRRVIPAERFSRSAHRYKVL